MAYIRVNKQENPYVQIHKDFTENQELTWAAKGLMMYILSRPDNWKINQTDLIKRSSCGEAVVRKALWNLMEQGYIYYYAERENGKIKEWVYEVYEHPDFNPHKEEAQKIARKKIQTKKKKQKERNDLKKVDNSTKTPERSNHVVVENDTKTPERSNHVVVENSDSPERSNSDLSNYAYNKNNINKNNINTDIDIDNIYLSKKEEIKNSNIPDQLKVILENQIDKLITFNLNIQTIELHFKTTTDIFSLSEYSHVLNSLLDQLVKKPDNFTNVLNNWLNRNKEKMNAAAAKKVNKPNKPTRTEIVPEWIKNQPKQEEQSPDFHERKAKLQARLKEKYKKNAQ